MLHQRETLRQILLFKDSQGQIMDLTGCTGYSQVREEPDDGALICTMGVTVSGEAGRVELTIPEETSAQIEPGAYAWDFAMMNAEGDVTYYVGGKFKLLPSVTEVPDE